MRTVGLSANGVSYSKVAAHLDPSSFPEGSAEWFDAVGNDEADRTAKLGANSHLQPSSAEVEDQATITKALESYLKFVARTLEVSPALPKPRGRQGRRSRLKRAGPRWEGRA
eukprot:5400269-Pyramimonas_sp.AAC.1